MSLLEVKDLCTEIGIGARVVRAVDIVECRGMHDVDEPLAHVVGEARWARVVHPHVLVHVEPSEVLPRDVVASGQRVEEREL